MDSRKLLESDVQKKYAELREANVLRVFFPTNQLVLFFCMLYLNFCFVKCFIVVRKNSSRRVSSLI